jgi:hypothetical protein
VWHIGILEDKSGVVFIVLFKVIIDLIQAVGVDENIDPRHLVIFEDVARPREILGMDKAYKKQYG